MSEANSKKSNIIEILLYLFIGAFSIAYPLFVGLARRGFEESFVGGKALEFGSYLANFLTYTPFIIVAFLCVINPIMKSITLKPNQHPSTTSNPKWHRIFTISYLFSPEENSILYNINLKNRRGNIFGWLRNPIKVFWIAILLFTPFMLLLAGNPQLAVAGVPQLQVQQVTLGAEIGFGALVPAFAENGLLIFFMQLFLGILAYILAKFDNKNKWYYFGLSFLVMFLLAFMWGGFHQIVYGNSDASFWGAVLFGGMGVLFTLLTGSIIFFFVFHIANNTGLILESFVTLKEDLYLVGWTIWALLLILTIGISINNRRKNKKLVNGIPN